MQNKQVKLAQLAKLLTNGATYVQPQLKMAVHERVRPTYLLEIVIVISKFLKRYSKTFRV